MTASQTWQHNPRFIEKFTNSTVGCALAALTTMTHSFVLISNFLSSYNLLLLSHHIKISYSGIPLLFLKRVMRILPVFLLVNGFSATWWTAFGDGPLWLPLVGAESQICREKFWRQAFFLQNMYNGDKICNVQTWVMVVDVQLYIPSLVITIWLMKRRERAVPFLVGLLSAATASTTYVALVKELMPSFYYGTPENYRQMFHNFRHFKQLFIMPINCIISMVTGISLGFIHYNIQQKNSKTKDEKLKKTKPSMIVIVLHYLALPMVFIWSYICSLLIRITDPVYMALMIPTERLFMSLLTFTFILTSTKVKSFYTDIFAWRGMRVISYVSMSVAMVHWCVNKTLLANQNTLFDASYGMMLFIMIGVSVISFILAIPLTILVEYPVGKIMDKLLTFLVKIK